MNSTFDLHAPLPPGRLVIEASAGTGKTYSLTALVVRSVVERGIVPSSMLIVTFTRVAAAELRDRTRQALVSASAAVRSGQCPAEHSWMQTLLDEPDRAKVQHRLDHAIASFDDATITTIHGFCQVALSQLGLKSGARIGAELGPSHTRLVDEVVRDILLPELAATPNALDWEGDLSASKVVKHFTSAVRKRLANPTAALVPANGAFTPNKTDTKDRIERWCDLVVRAADTVVDRVRLRNELGFDDLLVAMRYAVCDAPSAAVTVQALRDRYHLVMVDEFQDTDPVQWDMFHTAFGDRLITVGDPKQAIYRFRGADISTYLAATHGAPMVRLGTNFRSDRLLVEATNSLIDGVQMGHPAIVGAPVAASPRAVDQALAGPVLDVRWLPFHPDLATEATAKKSQNQANKSEAAILADLVRVVIELIDHGQIDAKPDQPARRVRPNDIAVLVRSRANATSVADALRAAGIPSVQARTGNVLKGEAARDWSLLLAALVRPSDGALARAAAISSFVPHQLIDLDPVDPDSAARLAEVQQLLASWAELLTRTTFSAWYRQISDEGGLVVRLLAHTDGERRLTDLEHVAELIATELESGGNSPGTVRRVLTALVEEAADTSEGDTPERHMRRIDSDATAVQISTIHGSKGLQYPIVLLPYSPSLDGDYDAVYTDANGRRTVDIAEKRSWDGTTPDTTLAARKWSSKAAQHGDGLRLFYVGVTRAEHRTVLWWTPGWTSHQSAFNHFLFDRLPDGTPRNSAPDPATKTIPNVPNPSDPGQALQQLADHSAGRIHITEIAPDLSHLTMKPKKVEAGQEPVGVADTAGRVVAQPSWRRWSFTSISNTREHDWTAHTPSAPTPPVVGGNDEPSTDVGSTLDASTVSDGSSPTVGSTVAMPWADVAGGTEFGTLVHELFEQVDPAAPDLAGHVRELVGGTFRRSRSVLTDEVLTNGLVAAIRTPLGPIADGLRLADITRTDRLAELDFDLPFGATAVTPAQIGKVLLDTLADDDPQREYAQQLADQRFTVDLRGFLQGSIDAVLRIPDTDGGHRYVVVDYKTNRLHVPHDPDPIAAYHPDHLPAHMAHSDYPLQALLYSVALHRMLSWRLGSAYDPEVHLGGIAYLFVRGMVGEHTPTAEGRTFGVFSWRPPATAIVALHHLFAGEVTP